MNQQGGVMKAMIGGILFAIGLLVMMTLWSPLIGIVLPLFANAQTVALGAVTVSIILLVPAIVVFTGIVALVQEAFGGNEPQYYR